LASRELEEIYGTVEEEIDEGEYPEPSPSSSFWKKVIGAIPVGLLIAGTLAPALYANIARLSLSTQKDSQAQEEELKCTANGISSTAYSASDQRFAYYSAIALPLRATRVSVTQCGPFYCLSTDVRKAFGQGILVRVNYEGRNVYFYIGWVPAVKGVTTLAVVQGGKSFKSLSLTKYLEEFGMDLEAIGGKLGVIPVYPLTKDVEVWYNPPIYQEDTTVGSIIPWYAVAYTYGSDIATRLVDDYTRGCKVYGCNGLTFIEFGRNIELKLSLVSALSDSPPRIMPLGTYQVLDVATLAWIYKYLAEVLKVNFSNGLVLSPNEFDLGAPAFIYTKCSSINRNTNACDGFECANGGLWGLIYYVGLLTNLQTPSGNAYGYPVMVFDVSRVARNLGAYEWNVNLVEAIALEIKSLFKLPENYLDLVKKLAKLTALVVALMGTYRMGSELAEHVVESAAYPEAYGKVYAEASEKFREIVLNSSLNGEVKEAVVNRDKEIFEVITENCDFFYDLNNWKVGAMAEKAFEVLMTILKGEKVDCQEDTADEVNSIIESYIEGLRGPHVEEE
jgi:hypothetical protein